MKSYEILSHICISLCIIIPSTICIILFSSILYGTELYIYLIKNYIYSYYLLSIGIFIIILLYLLDIRYIKKYIYIKIILYIIIIIILYFGILFSTHKYSSLPLMLCLFSIPMFVFFLSFLLNEPYQREQLYLNVMIVSLITSCVILTVWLCWVWGVLTETHYLWNEETRIDLKNRLGVYFTDLRRYFLWVNPFICSITLFCVFVVAFFRREMLKAGRLQPRVGSALKMVIVVSLLLCLGVWIAASVAGASMSLAGSVVAFLAAGIIVLGVYIYMTLGQEKIRKELGEYRMWNQFMEAVTGDWGCALLVFVLGWLGVLFFLASFVNQFFRKIFHRKRMMDEDAYQGYLTSEAHKVYVNLKNWHWTSILSKVLKIGLIFVLIQVGVSKAVTIFLSYINAVLSVLGLWTAIGIFIAVGICMFLLPPVPGVPVYLAGGIVITAATVGNNLSFVLGIVIASVACLVLKAIAIVLQQKLFGELMSQNLTIQSLCGVNTVPIRAIEMCLRRPGISVDKVSILIGGPDWPTSVLTGILRLSVFQMLLGSSPVIILVVPCVLAGAFLLKTGESDEWKAISSVTLSLAALLQALSGALAFYYVQDVADKNYDELSAPRPEHAELDRRAQAVKAKARIVREKINWIATPLWLKILLILGVVIVNASCFLLQFTNDYCFTDYALTDTIEDKLDGNILNLVLTLGWVALAMSAFSLLILLIFSIWAHFKSKEALNIHNSENLTPCSISKNDEILNKSKKIHKKKSDSKTSNLDILDSKTSNLDISDSKTSNLNILDSQTSNLNI
eukprot:GHVL01027664.1.p1 GENE.GHVL01027664.1~~GHVL01027664.1.p1  ORF type:complete len:792 (+),score=116.07 GHVL01027664.1:53-2428(+)